MFLVAFCYIFIIIINKATYPNRTRTNSSRDLVLCVSLMTLMLMNFVRIEQLVADLGQTGPVMFNLEGETQSQTSPKDG